MNEVEELRKRLDHKDRLAPISRRGRRMDWRFDAYRDLLQRLGHGDGMAEVMEVATRDFLDAARASGDPDSYLTSRAKAQKIVVDELDMVNLPARAATLYIVGAYQQLEGFLKDLVGEVDEICGRTSRSRHNGEAPLDWALEMLPGGRHRNTRRIWIERYAVLEYYRAVRNGFMHSSKSASSLEAAHRKVLEYRPLLEADYKLAGPSAADRLTLDDFLLFTRTIKYVATDLCRIGVPTLADVQAHAERKIAGDRAFRNTTWDTISKEKAARKIVKYYRRFDFDLGAHPGVIEQIVNAQFERVGRF